MAFSYFQLCFLVIIRYSTWQFDILINIKYYIFKKSYWSMQHRPTTKRCLVGRHSIHLSSVFDQQTFGLTPTTFFSPFFYLFFSILVFEPLIFQSSPSIYFFLDLIPVFLLLFILFEIIYNLFFNFIFLYFFLSNLIIILLIDIFLFENF